MKWNGITGRWGNMESMTPTEMRQIEITEGYERLRAENEVLRAGKGGAVKYIVYWWRKLTGTNKNRKKPCLHKAAGNKVKGILQ